MEASSLGPSNFAYVPLETTLADQLKMKFPSMTTIPMGETFRMMKVENGPLLQDFAEGKRRGSSDIIR